MTANYKFNALKSIVQSPTLITSLRTSYLQTGVATIPNFLSPPELKSAINSCKKNTKTTPKKTKDCFITNTKHNCYLLPSDSSFPSNHIRNRELETKVASIANDELPKGGVLLSLYENPLFLTLISNIVLGNSANKKLLYTSMDPIGACSVNVFKADWRHGYHFDESEFSVTLMLQRPAKGGIFEMSSRLRSSGNEMVYEKVEAIVNDDGEVDSHGIERSTNDDVTPLLFEPGTLSVFAGNSSLHRVTSCKGAVDRLVAVFTFSSVPGFTNSKKVQEMFWGRSATKTQME